MPLILPQEVVGARYQPGRDDALGPQVEPEGDELKEDENGDHAGLQKSLTAASPDPPAPSPSPPGRRWRR